MQQVYNGEFGGKIGFLNDVQAAKILGLKAQTLRNWRGQAKGPPYVKAGRAVRYSLQDLISFMTARRIDPEKGGTI